MIYSVIDLEKSLCGDCEHYRVCVIPVRIESVGDDMFDLHIKVSITECKAYKEVQLSGTEERQVATA